MMKISGIRNGAIVLISAGMCLATTGCDKNDVNKTPIGASASVGDSAASKAADTKADNTAKNKDHDVTKSPMDQGQNAADIKITADIRRAILDDKVMSMSAQNCKVITENGVVTLRGPVDTAAEKQSIEAKAKLVVGVKSVDNQLEVKTN